MSKLKRTALDPHILNAFDNFVANEKEEKENLYDTIPEPESEHQLQFDDFNSDCDSQGTIDEEKPSNHSPVFLDNQKLLNFKSKRSSILENLPTSR